MSLLLLPPGNLIAAGGRPFWAIRDSFSRADSTATLGNANTGQAWVATTGTWGISSARGYAVSNTSNDLATLPVSGQNYEMLCWLSESSYSGSGPGLAFRVIGANEWLRATLVTNTLRLAKRDDGSPPTDTTLAETAVTTSVDVAYAVGILTNGNAITLSLDGVPKITYTLTGADAAKFSGPTATRVGLILRGTGNTARYLNFRLRLL